MLNLLRRQAAAALIGLAALEAIFATMLRLGNLKVHAVETIALGLAAGIFYFLALFAFDHLGESRAAFWLILAGALVFRLTLAPLDPTLSDDIQRYRWDGLVQNAGFNPYAVPPNDPRLAPLRSALGAGRWAAMPGREIRAVYPPVSELVFRVTWRLLPGPVAFKLPFLLADLLIVALLGGWVRATGGKNFQLAIYAWNPLVIVEFAGSGHNDAVALLLLVAALMIIKRRRMVSTSLLAAAALAKAFPAALAPVWLRRTGWKSALGAAAVTVACAWPYRLAWPYLRETFAYYESRWQNYNPSLYAVLAWFSGSRELAAGLGAGVVAGLAVWAAARRLDVTRVAYLLIAAILMLAPNGYSWYFTWIVPLVCFFPNPAWLLLTILQFLSYNVLIDYQANGRWHFDPFFQWLTYAPFYSLLLWQAWRNRTRSRALSS